MELNDRKKRILQAIVDDYIQTAEPVGSSYLLGSHNLGVSSATVRNEMALLEELGYLDKPHTSAGRVPSYLGYRIYVDELMNEYRLSLQEINQIKHALQQQYLELGKLIGNISDMMSKLTKYTAIVTAPAASSSQIKNIKLIGIDEYSFVMIVVTSDGNVKNQTIRTQKPIDSDVLERLSNYMNHKFSDVDVETLTSETLEQERALIPAENALLDPVFDFLNGTVEELSDVDMVTTGMTNIFNHPEFNDIDRTKDFLNFLRKDNKKYLKKVLQADGEQTNVIIADEDPILKEHDLSIVVSNYSLGGGMKGKLAVIGPTRMEYAKVISTLDYLTACLNGFIQGRSD